MATDNEKPATLAFVTEQVGTRSFFVLGWCSGRCDKVGPRFVLPDDEQNALAARLSNDPRNQQDWKDGYAAGVSGSRSAVLLMADRMRSGKNLKQHDEVEWLDGWGQWRQGIVVEEAGVGDTWPLLRVVMLNGEERVVRMDPMAIRRKASP